MPTTVTIDKVRSDTARVERRVQISSAFLVDEGLTVVGGIKVYGHDVVDRFLVLHNGCMPPEESAHISAKDLPGDAESIMATVFRLGYIIVEGESPLGHDFEHGAPRLLLLGSLKASRRTWLEGLERKARHLAMELPD